MELIFNRQYDGEEWTISGGEKRGEPVVATEKGSGAKVELWIGDNIYGGVTFRLCVVEGSEPGPDSKAAEATAETFQAIGQYIEGAKTRALGHGDDRPLIDPSRDLVNSAVSMYMTLQDRSLMRKALIHIIAQQADSANIEMARPLSTLKQIDGIGGKAQSNDRNIDAR